MLLSVFLADVYVSCKCAQSIMESYLWIKCFCLQPSIKKNLKIVLVSTNYGQTCVHKCNTCSEIQILRHWLVMSQNKTLDRFETDPGKYVYIWCCNFKDKWYNNNTLLKGASSAANKQVQSNNKGNPWNELGGHLLDCLLFTLWGAHVGGTFFLDWTLGFIQWSLVGPFYIY